MQEKGYTRVGICAWVQALLSVPLTVPTVGASKSLREKAKPILLQIAIETGTVVAALRGPSTSLLRLEKLHGALHHGAFADTVPATQRLHIALSAVSAHTACAAEQGSTSQVSRSVMCSGVAGAEHLACDPATGQGGPPPDSRV
ncbi:hypothetical protein NDU88_004496 [Pleurodeles waltl]|uniref:Uncharacterized protein n=1 Tax=Pleurodeles waltl TaxID=8319 RepID=A0AAV7LLJ9_PLEWA|nr:hypothetical protein NDU88_004496 [Pleurodeles waltl]